MPWSRVSGPKLLPSAAAWAPYQAMPTRPRLPAAIHGMTLLPSSGGETSNGPSHDFAPSVETASLITPGPMGAVESLVVGYSAHATYTTPVSSTAIAGNSVPVV